MLSGSSLGAQWELSGSSSQLRVYKIWRSKQNLGFLGTRVQVGRYLGDACADKRCPNCGRQETAMHLMLCSDEDRTRLLIEKRTDRVDGTGQQDQPRIIVLDP
jgi:hypothetical protein